MLSLVLMTALAAVPGRQLPDADVVLHAPSVQTASGLSALLDRAGRDAPSVATSQRLVFPLLDRDALSAERLAALGGAAASPLTSSVRGSRALACLSVADVKRFDEAMTSRVQAQGSATATSLPGVTGMRSGAGSVTLGWVRKRSEACTWSSAANEADATERDAIAALARPSGKRAKPKPGLAFAAAQLQGQADGDASRLTATGRTQLRGLPPLGRAGIARYAGTPMGGSAQAVLKLEQQGASRLLDPMLRRLSGVCSGCDAASLRAQLAKLGPLLTGEAVVRAGIFRPTEAGLRSQLGRYRALPFAVALQVKDAARVDALLAPLGARPGATAIPGGVRLGLAPGAELRLFRVGDTLLVGSSEALASELAAALPPKGAAQPHAGVVTLVPREVSAALARLPLLEVLASPELAPLLVVERELGGLLSASRRLELGLDPVPGAKGGRVAFAATWELSPQVGAPAPR